MKNAYRLCTFKNNDTYIADGYTEEEAQAIINYAWDIDEDFTSKKEYIKQAKIYASQITKALEFEKPLNWKAIFGEPMENGYKYCSKCDTYFYDDEGCECDE